MTPAKRREIETKRQYRFEEEAKILAPFRKQLTFNTLNEFASMFWENEGRSFSYFPLIIFGQGVKQGTRHMSYAQAGNPSKIILAPYQRDKITVLHEILHCVGFSEHDRDFFTAQVKYLYLFCGYDFNDLVTEGKKFKLEYKY